MPKWDAPGETIQEASLESLRAARTLQKMRRSHGVNRVDLIVEDVDSDWTEQGSEEEALGSKATPEQIQ